VIAPWPSFSLIAAYELLMRQVRRAAGMAKVAQRSRKATGSVASTTQAALVGSRCEGRRQRSSGDW
jgi:hypothetical protein